MWIPCLKHWCLNSSVNRLASANVGTGNSTCICVYRAMLRFFYFGSGMDLTVFYDYFFSIAGALKVSHRDTQKKKKAWFFLLFQESRNCLSIDRP